MRTRDYHGKLPGVDFSEQAYKGYLIRTNALTGDMWIEKGGHLIHRVPRHKSWAYAREQIDLLTDENPRRNPRRTHRKGSWPKGKTPPHLKRYLFK
jgi:hypothetical protein